MRHSIPLLILGLIRLYSVKGLDYAEHVTEYGVHWNFFFTLTFLPPFVEVFHTIVTTVVPSYDILAVLLAAIYEIVLDTTDLKAYILVSPRGSSLLSKNREGVFSFIGYLAIFLAGRGLGLIVIPDQQQATSKTRRRNLLKSLLLRSTTWWLLYYITNTPTFRIPPIPSSWDDITTHSITSKIPVLDLGLALGVSRRLANLPYVLWVIAFNTSQILLFCLIETYYFPSVHLSTQTSSSTIKDDEISEAEKATPLIMRSFNKNGLAIFLVANLLTGLVNLTVNTIDIGEFGSMAILLAYSAVVTVVAVGMDLGGLKLKL